jgi:hypothetical protein
VALTATIKLSGIGYCTDHYIYKQNCTINCYCEIICGACYKVEACG